MKRTNVLLKATGVLIGLGLALSAQAAEQCQTLYAGQTIEAGSVCVNNDAQYLTVTYNTTGGWSLDEVHLFVGHSLAEMPQTKTGNPKVGLFPYTADADGTEYQFKLPLGDFGDCGETLAIAAHAVVQRTTASGTVTSETGWADGSRVTAKGNWATWFNYTSECTSVSGCGSTETAFAFGDQTLMDLGTGINRWGWQISVSPNSSGAEPLYAGAAQNEPSKGTHVGEVVYTYYGDHLTLSYQTLAGYSLDETHVYAGNSNLVSGAPGSYGNQADHAAGTTYYTYEIDVADPESDGIVVVAHASVCMMQ